MKLLPDDVFKQYAGACRQSEEPLVLALFALLDQHIPVCKEAAICLQQHSAEWELQDWALPTFRQSLQSAGLSCHPDCLSLVGIPL